MSDDTLSPEERKLLFNQWMARKHGLKSPAREALEELITEDALERLREQYLADKAQETDPKPPYDYLDDPDAMMVDLMKRGLTMDHLMGRTPKGKTSSSSD